MRFNRGDFLNIPNYISVVRIAAVPLLIIFMMMIRVPEAAHPVWNAWISFVAAVTYGIASVSDMVDGFLARRARMDSAVGKSLDPLADKLLNLSALILLIPPGRIQAWLVIIILAREITITALRGMAANERIVIPASKWGKMKNAFGSFGIAFLILHYKSFGIDWMAAGWALLIISVVFSVGSGIHYAWCFFAEAGRNRAL